MDFKVRQARRFLETGNKVKFTVRFRGREITHPEKAQEQLDVIIKEIEDIANVEVRPMMEGRTMTLLVAPKPAVMQRVSQMKAAAEKARQQAIKEGRAVPLEEEEHEEPDEDDDDDDDDDEEADAHEERA
jgi:translation initiation factor IF-3